MGLKPTYGRVSRYGVIPLSWSLDHCGPMARVVEDVALMLQVVAGYDPRDQTTGRAQVPNYWAALREDVKGLRVGVPRHFFLDARSEVNPETMAAVDRALADLEGLGAKIQEMTIPCLGYAGIANWAILLSEAFGYHRKDLLSQWQNYGDIVCTRLLLGSLFTSSNYVQAQRARNKARGEFAQAFQRVDVLATPTMVKPAIPFKEVDPLATMLAKTFTSPYNLVGIPAISIPCGFSSNGLPIGLQIAGRPFDELTVLRAAYTYQQHAKWHERRPPCT